MLKKAAALFLACVGLALCLSCGKSKNNFVYAAIPGAGQILIYREDPNSGALTPLSVSPISAGAGVQSVVIHPSKQFLYAANSAEDDISLFTIASTGAITEVTPRTPVTPLGTTPTFLVMDPAGNFLYVGNAESNNISVFSISSSGGGLTPLTNSPFVTGISPLNMALAPSGNFLYVTGSGSLGYGYIEVFSLAGLTSQSPELNLVQTAQTGVNPYGLAINPAGSYLYTANFSANSISSFTINTDGSLTALGSPIGEAYSSPISLLIDNSGKYLYVANQGSGNLGAYSIGSDGGLALLTTSPFTSNPQPSVIASDPSGIYLFVGNQKGASIESLTLNTSTGALAEVGTYAVGNTPTSIAVLAP